MRLFLFSLTRSPFVRMVFSPHSPHRCSMSVTEPLPSVHTSANGRGDWACCAAQGQLAADSSDRPSATALPTWIG